MYVITVLVLITRNEGKGEHKSNYSSEEELSFFHGLSFYYKGMLRQRQSKISGVTILQNLVVILQKRKIARIHCETGDSAISDYR